MNTTTHDTKTTTWNLDPAHSSVGFRVRHLMITNVHGEFQGVSGTLRYEPGHIEDARISVDIQAASISTRVEQRDAHLRSGDFFDTENHPVITFRSTGARAAGPNRAEVKGDLTIRGITREATLTVTEVTGEQRDHVGATRIGASATAIVKRSDFGMTYNKVLEAGGVAVADEVSLMLDLSLVKSPAS